VAMASSWTIEALRDELASLEDELQRRQRRQARERAVLLSRIDALAEHVASEASRADRMREAVRSLEQDLTAARATLQETERQRRVLEGELARRERSVKHHAEQLQAQDELLQTLAAGIAEVRGDVERIAESRAWRVGHRLALTADRLRMRRRVTDGAVAAALVRLSALGETAGDARSQDRRTASDHTGLSPMRGEQSLDEAGRAELARRIRSRLGASPKRSRWPMVSIVVLNRNGESHLRRLLGGLTSQTDYPRFELIVVDNDSSDGSREYLRALQPTLSLTLIENDENLSFSAGNAQGAARARGELLLFLNNDVEPFERGWLRELAALAARDGVGAVGATLLHAEELVGGIPLVQHRGIRMRFKEGRFQPYNLDDGGTLFSERFGVDVGSPAATGACLMMRKELFDRLGGFPEGYRYGTEDVDLGFQVVAARATVLTSGRAHLLHRESSTQEVEGREFKRRNRLGNQRLFAERWDSRLRREYRVSRLRDDPYWADGEAPHLAITLSSTDQADGFGDWYTGHELGDALKQLGWQVTYVQRKEDAWYTLPEALDYLLVLLDSYDLRNLSTRPLTIAWVRGWTERWLQRKWFGMYDLVLASSRGSAELIERSAGVKPIDFPLATNPARFQRVASEPELAADMVFTGNRWNRPREVQALRPHAGETLRVFGSGWEDVPELASYAHGPVAYQRLPAVYSSASVVVDDTAEHTLPYGAVNSRVFDALACGTVVATNCQSGVHDLFDAEFPTWKDAESLRTRLDQLLADDRRRESLALRYQRIVRERHTYDHRARQLVAALEQAEERLSFCIKTGAPNRDVASEWGDVHFGEALARELRRRGHRCIVQVLDEWEEQAGLQYDVVVHLKGLSRYTPKPGQFNVLWCISHPDGLSAQECESYDLVCVASERFAAELSKRIEVPVEVLEQATDPHLFYPESDPRYEHELLFVANSRKVLRRVMCDLLPTERELAVYGTNWSGLIDERYIAGEHVPNDELRRAYSTAAIVLNDHWDDMRAHGFVSNRIYDALACEALVVSDHMPELEDRFGDAVLTYRDRDQLHGLIERLLSSPEERAQRGRNGRDAVLARYTFEQRVDELLTIIARSAGETRVIRPAGQGTKDATLRTRGRIRWRIGRRRSTPAPGLEHALSKAR
jgi:O-antigen biosynthesis protein